MTYNPFEIKAIMEEEVFTLKDKLQLIVGTGANETISGVECYISIMSELRLDNLKKYNSYKMSYLDAKRSYEDAVAELSSNTSDCDVSWKTEMKQVWEDSIDYWKNAMSEITEEIKIREGVIDFLRSKDVIDLLQPTEKKNC